jgi:cytochrome c peroxidase
MAALARAIGLGIGCGLFVLPALALTQSAAPPPPPRPLPELRGGGITIRNVIARRPRRLAEMTLPVPADNPITDAKTALGRRLFFDPSLSQNGSVSCATCHDPDRAFADARPLAVGVFDRVGRRHSPALVNRGFGRAHFWDGRARTLEEQVTQPIEDPNEMASTVGAVVERLGADASYAAAFDAAFSRPVNAVDLARALATYLRTVRSGDAPYDRFVDNQSGALGPQAQTGLRLFRSKARCTFCHIEPTFTDEQFHNTGISWQPSAGGTGAFADEGRFEVTRQPRDRGAFKTPTLREIARTAPYMHDGSLATLMDVVEFYDKGGRANPNLTRLIRPIGLTTDEKQALVAFLESLSGTVTGK